MLKEELERYGELDCYLSLVECGKIKPETLVIRANAGDWIAEKAKNIFGTLIKNTVSVCYSPSAICEITDITDYSV